MEEVVCCQSILALNVFQSYVFHIAEKKLEVYLMIYVVKDLLMKQVHLHEFHSNLEIELLKMKYFFHHYTAKNQQAKITKTMKETLLMVAMRL